MFGLFCFAAAVSAPPLNIDVRCDVLPNLIYELDVVSGRLPWESDKNFKQLWRSQFLKSSADQLALQNWREAREVDNGMGEDLPNFPIEDVGVPNDLETKMRRAGILSNSPQEYRLEIEKLLKTDQADRLADVVEHFYPSYANWWKNEAEKEANRFSLGLSNLVKSDKVQSNLAQFAAFYQSKNIENANLKVQLMFRPGQLRETSSGQQIGDASVVQFLPGENPEDRIDVVVHELCHFLYQSADPDSLKDLQTRFAKLDNPSSLPSFFLMNEVLAATCGNAIAMESIKTKDEFEAYLQRPRSLYCNDNIDLGAKSCFNWLKSYLQSGKSIHDHDFPSLYCQAMEKGFGDKLTRPSMYLSTSLLFVDECFDDGFLNLFRKKLDMASVWAVSGNFKGKSELNLRERKPLLSSVILIPSAKLDRLTSLGFLTQDESDQLRNQARQRGSSLLTKPHGTKAFDFFIVSDTGIAVKTEVEKLASLQRTEPTPKSG